MEQEKIEHCQLCGSLCRVRTSPEGTCYYSPFLRRAEDEGSKEKLIDLLRSGKYCQQRLDTAIECLRHVREFLQNKGHKMMYLQVKDCLKTITETDT